MKETRLMYPKSLLPTVAFALASSALLAAPKEHPPAGKPSPESRVVHFAEEPPGYVFDTIPFWWNGAFHLFYLNGELDADGKKVGVKWSHSTTKDFVKWEKLPDAVLPGDLDANVWTGSVMEKDGTFYLFYTGKSLPDKPDPKGDQKVMLATSKDLVTFTKRPEFTFYADGKFYWNKIINGPLDPKRPIAAQFDESFRDPEVFWNDEAGEYWMLLHSRDAKTQFHNFGLYRSDDLLSWTPRAPLQTSAEVHRRNIDCPDVFKLGDKWVLIFSGCRYATADRIEGPYSDNRSYENNFFVPKTAIDDKGRVLTAATVRANERFSDRESKTRGGEGGRASMVREFYLGSNGRLLMRPLPEVAAHFQFSAITLDAMAGGTIAGDVRRDGKALVLKAANGTPAIARLADAPPDFFADFTVTLAPDSTFRFQFRERGGEAYFVSLSTADNLVVVGNPWTNTESHEGYKDRDLRVAADTPLRVRLFMVGDMIECFVDDVASLTINAYDLKSGGMSLVADHGTATVSDFNIRLAGDALERSPVAPSAFTPTAPDTAASSLPTAGMDVLFVAVDDLNSSLTAFDGGQPIRMPNLARLADRGAFFTRAYCTTPACNPSRAAVLSGQLPTTSGLYNNPDKLENHHRDTVFLPQYFQQHGFRTWGIGKILHGEPLDAGDSTRPIFQKFQAMDKSMRPKEKINGPTKGPGKPATYDWGQMSGQLTDDITVEKAAEWLREPHTGPVFQAVGIFSPHLPHYARAEHFAQYPMDQLAMSPMPKDDFDDIPPAGRAMSDFQKNWNQQIFDARGRGDLGPLSKLVQSYYAAATYGDEMLGRLIDALDATGLADRTIIVLWADHGYHLGDKDSVVKFTLWEKATHVPLVIVAPGVTTPGSRIGAPVSLIDIYPTLVELAGLPPKPGLDGQSLVPLLKNPDAEWPRPAITTQGRGNHAVRSKDWRYIRYADGSEELYKDSDPWNHTNLVSNPESAGVIAGLRQGLPKAEAPSATNPASEQP